MTDEELKQLVASLAIEQQKTSMQMLLDFGQIKHTICLICLFCKVVLLIGALPKLLSRPELAVNEEV